MTSTITYDYIEIYEKYINLIQSEQLISENDIGHNDKHSAEFITDHYDPDYRGSLNLFKSDNIGQIKTDSTWEIILISTNI